MRKIAILVALLMVVGAVPGFSLTATVDGFLERRAESDIHPVADSAVLLGHVNDGIDKTIDAADPVLRHRKHITDPVMRGAKTIVNGAWDLLMRLNPMHNRDDK